MSAISQFVSDWVDGAKAFVKDPAQAIETLFAPDPFSGVSGFGGFQAFDSVPDARVRATGINPATNALTAPQYATTLQLNGVDPTDPNAVKLFADTLREQATTQYKRDLQNETNSGSSFNFLNLPNVDKSTVVVLGLMALALVFIVLEAVN